MWQTHKYISIPKLSTNHLYNLCNQVSNIPDAGSLPQPSKTKNVAPQSNLTLQAPPPPPPIPPVIRQNRQISHTITSGMIQSTRSRGGNIKITNNAGESQTILVGGNRPLGASTPQPNNGKFHSLSNILLNLQ